MDSPHSKTLLLLQSHWNRVPVPIKDYHDDTKSILDQVPRVLTALIRAAGNFGLLPTVLSAIKLSQMTVQALWFDSNPLLQFRSLNLNNVKRVKNSLSELLLMPRRKAESILHKAGN